jgi:hypothetical protein
VVEAIVFDGSFPLEFLQPGEHVAASSKEAGAAAVVKDGKVLATVRPGMVLVREAEGELWALGRDVFDSSYEQVGDQ